MSNKRSLFLDLIFSLSVTLILILITPLDLIFINKNDFCVTLSEMVSCLVLPSIIVFVFIFLLLSFFSIINSKIYEIIKILFTSIVIAFYVQELFLNGKMVRSDLGTTVGEISGFEESLNILINFIICFFPSLIAGYCLFNTDYKSNRLTNLVYHCIDKNLVVFLLVGITVMKSAGLISDYMANNNQKYEQNNRSDLLFFSYEPTVSFSKENNVYVFIIDRFDSLWCDDFLKYYPEVTEELEGFTFYRNNISSYTNTFPSITNMFTDVAYDGSEWNTYFESAWNGENVFSIVRNNGYDVNLILDEANTYGTSYRISSFCDNIVVPKNLERIIDNDELRKIIFKLSFLRMVPYSFKFYFESVVTDVSEQVYIIYSADDMEKIHTGTVNTNSDCHMFDYTETAEFDSDSEKKILTAIHLHGAHDYNPNLCQRMECSNLENDGLYMTIRANFETVLRYIRAAKELGVYDNTTFIILGDHGRAPDFYYDDENEKKLTEPLVTALLVKPPHADRIKMKIDSESQLSNTMLFASILEYAGIDHSKYGYSFNDIIKFKKDISREIHTYLWNGTGKVDLLHDYVVNGDARDFSNWKLADAG